MSYVYDSTELAWISGFDSNHGTFSVVTSDRSKYGIESEWNMRVTLNLPDSLMSDDEVTIISQFAVYLKDACADNELSIAEANEIGEQLYYVGETAIPVLATVDQTVSISTCPLDVVLEYWDEKLRIWRDYSELTTDHGQEEHTSFTAFTSTFVDSFTAVDTGAFNIYTDDTSDEYDGPDTSYTEIEMRLTFTDPYSDEATNTVSD